jgi:hypothetical protein
VWHVSISWQQRDGLPPLPIETLNTEQLWRVKRAASASLRSVGVGHPFPFHAGWVTVTLQLWKFLSPAEIDQLPADQLPDMWYEEGVLLRDQPS